jgi:DNA-binding MarR family transcriptional regulator
VELGALVRKPDPKDARAKRVVSTRRGAAANEVKRAIKAAHRERLGRRRLMRW